MASHLLKDPGGESGIILNDALREPASIWKRSERRILIGRRTRVEGRRDPQFDLLLGVLNRVGTVEDGAANVECKVASDSTCNFGERRSSTRG